MASVRDEVERQLASNKNALPYFEVFREHRERLTALALEGDGERRELCVLGAGNCFDLDLERLAQNYHRVHLVDFDKQAVTRARARQPKLTRNKLVLHAPIDLSGCNPLLERWRDLQATPEELMAVPGRVSEEIAGRLPGPFHTVLSACLLSQLLLTGRRVLGEHHPLFDASQLVLTLAHLRTLVRLTRPGGRGVLATDVTSSEIAELPSVAPGTDQRALLARLSLAGQVFQATAPSSIAALVAEDPMLRRDATLSAPLCAWTWRNGPERAFLVYGVEFLRTG